ncbi:MAG TPA: hydroxylamine reductase, partial [Desulfobacterales bacterium]|nr:hydroxylamine reductase [Desulfobacterales bacterium]
MFCFQCEQTAKGEGCTKLGVCGKQPDVAALQDLLVYEIKELSRIAVEGRKVGLVDGAVNQFTCEALFSTLTNVDFDPERFVEMLARCVQVREDLKKRVAAAGGKTDFGPERVTHAPGAGKEELVALGEQVGVKADPDLDPDLLSLRELLIYGLKGVAAYADHARILGQVDDRVDAFIHEALAATL